METKKNDEEDELRSSSSGESVILLGLSIYGHEWKLPMLACPTIDPVDGEWLINFNVQHNLFF